MVNTAMAKGILIFKVRKIGAILTKCLFSVKLLLFLIIQRKFHLKQKTSSSLFLNLVKLVE